MQAYEKVPHQSYHTLLLLEPSSNNHGQSRPIPCQILYESDLR